MCSEFMTTQTFACSHYKFFGSVFNTKITEKYMIWCLLWQKRQFTWWWWWWWWWWWYKCYFNMCCGSHTWCSCWNMQKTSYMTMLSCLIYFLKSHFIYIYFLMLQSEIFQQLSLYGHGQQTYFICRWIQHHDIYHINGIKHHIISVIIL